MKTLTSKALRMAVKHHTPISQLVHDYEFKSEEDFCLAIHRIFTQKSTALHIISSLKKNKKKFVPCKTSGKVPEEAIHTPEDLPTSETASTESLTTEEVPEDASASEALPTSESKGSHLSLLLAEEETLSIELIGLETEHKALVSEHLMSKKTLERMQRILQEIQRLMSKHQANLSQELDKICATSNQMALVSQKMKDARKHLGDVRAKLEELKKVSIFVYANGTFEAENADVPNTEEDVLNAKFMELIQWPRAKEFSVTLMELNTIAKLLLMTEHLASSGLAFEISFDSEEVQRFYEAVTATTAPA